MGRAEASPLPAKLCVWSSAETLSEAGEGGSSWRSATNSSGCATAERVSLLPSLVAPRFCFKLINALRLSGGSDF